MQVKARSGIILGIFLLLLFIGPSVSAADLADQYYGDGINFSLLGQYSEAVASYDKVVFIRPGNADAWNNRGVALDNLGQYSEAVSSYDKAVTLQPMNADAWYNRGLALRKLGRYVDAVVSYDRAVAANPGFVDAWLNRGVALDYLGRYADEVDSYDKVLALQPNSTIALENRVLALEKMNRLNPTTIALLVVFIIIIAGIVLYYTRPKPLSEQKMGLEKEIRGPFFSMEKRPEEKQLVYGTIPEESKLHTLASLCCVINMYGRSILDEPDKMATSLDELSHGDFERERHALIVALKDNVPQELLKPHHGFTWVSTSARLKKLLKEKHGMSDDFADWVIDTWAKALEMET